VPGKPYQSCLIPYRDEIFALRREAPPVSYARIADLLREKYGLNIRRAAIGKFVKVRSKGRKVHSYRRHICSPKPVEIAPIPKHRDQEPSDKPKPFFNYKPSDRYNLTRLPPEEAARRRKKLEEEGH
jgi:hypothetical protein